MDSSINAAARALAAGDPLAALNYVALRDDPAALALRGTAMAQLGELDGARQLLRRAERGFTTAPKARARCVVALAEIDLALRDLKPANRRLDAAIMFLEEAADHPSLAHARLLRARRLLLLGRVDDAERSLDAIGDRDLPPMLEATAGFVRADIARRRLYAKAAHRALDAAAAAAVHSGIRSLAAEIDRARAELEMPAARLVRCGEERLITLAEVETIATDDATLVLIVDACRRSVRVAGRSVTLKRRPILFQIAQVLGAAWPEPAPRDDLIVKVFEAKRPNESHRVRLRVEVGRLRRALRGLAGIEATAEGFVLVSQKNRDVVLLRPPADDEGAVVLALLADGAPWSTSSLSLALGVSQRTVQRTLKGLEDEGRVLKIGRARAQRWLVPPASGYATTLLLPMHGLVG